VLAVPYLYQPAVLLLGRVLVVAGGRFVPLVVVIRFEHTVLVVWARLLVMDRRVGPLPGYALVVC
jgi:hypothetical protein